MYVYVATTCLGGNNHTWLSVNLIHYHFILIKLISYYKNSFSIVCYEKAPPLCILNIFFCNFFNLNKIAIFQPEQLVSVFLSFV